MYMKNTINPIQKNKILSWLLLSLLTLMTIVVLSLDVFKQIEIKKFVLSLNHIKPIIGNSSSITMGGEYSINWTTILGAFFIFLIIGISFYFVSNKNKDKKIMTYPIISLIVFLVICILYLTMSNIFARSNFYIKGIDDENSLKGKNLAVYNQVKQIFNNNYSIIKISWFELGFIILTEAIAIITLWQINKNRKIFQTTNIQI